MITAEVLFTGGVRCIEHVGLDNAPHRVRHFAAACPRSRIAVKEQTSGYVRTYPRIMYVAVPRAALGCS